MRGIWRGARSEASPTLVLVVGASPAGLTAAIRLREQGVNVRVVDAQTADDGNTQSCVIHPRTVRILNSIGIAASLQWRGHDVTRLSVHTDGQRRATLELPSAGELGRGAMTLPRGVLHLALLRRLSELGTDVEWQTRLVQLEQGAMNVQVHLAQNARLDASCIDRAAEYVDLRSELVDAQFVVGADGPKSTVRGALGIEWIPRGPRRFYAFFEGPDERASNEGHLAIHDGLGSCIYPFQSGISRFSFEVTANMQQAPDPTWLRQLLDSRMPWYTAEVAHVEWSGHAELDAGLAARFGEGRVLLTGDAAHSTGPLGGQSLNVGVFEANELALRIIRHFARPRPVPLSVAYGEQRSLEWNRLFGLYPSVPATGRAAKWVKRNITAMLPHLPASGDDLDDLLDQLKVASA